VVKFISPQNINLKESNFSNIQGKTKICKILKNFRLYDTAQVHVCCYTKSSEMEIKNTLGIKKVQGQSEAAV